MNDPNKYVGHSGGALGSDYEWEVQGRKFGVNKFNHYWHGRKTPYGNFQLNDQQIEEGWQHALIANKTLKRRPEAYKSLLSRNWFQVKPVSCVYAIGELSPDKTQVKGGTGWAVQMAIDEHKEVYVFDQRLNKWFQYSYVADMFVLTLYYAPIEPVLSEQFACIGTRNLQSNGIQAIIDVYTKTFKK